MTNIFQCFYLQLLTEFFTQISCNSDRPASKFMVLWRVHAYDPTSVALACFMCMLSHSSPEDTHAFATAMASDSEGCRLQEILDGPKKEGKEKYQLTVSLGMAALVLPRLKMLLDDEDSLLDACCCYNMTSVFVSSAYFQSIMRFIQQGMMMTMTTEEEGIHTNQMDTASRTGSA